jgi:hypothetical protein
MKPSDVIALENKWVRLALSVGDNTWALEGRRAQIRWGNEANRRPWIAVQQAGDDGSRWNVYSTSGVYSNSSYDAGRC